MEYIAVTMEGLEDVAARELRGKKVGPGRVLFTQLKDDVRSADTIFCLIKRFIFSKKKNNPL